MKENTFKAKIGSFITSRRFIVVILLEIIVVLFAVYGISKTFAAADYWQLKLQDKVVGTVKTEKEANKLLSLLEKTYVETGAKDVEVSLKPSVEIKHNYYGYMDKKPAISKETEVHRAFNKLTKDNKIEVKTTQVINKSKKIKHKTIKKTDENVLLNTTVEKTAGKDGEKIVTLKQTSINDKVRSTKVLKTSVPKESEDKVVLSGTAVKPASRGETSSNLGERYSKKSGQEVVDFALKFVGNPYKYGGESLTNGADCSGFVLAVYKHFGVILPHSSIADQYLGKGVSLSEARPGDLICYGGHIGIYIGDNKLVHAMDEAHGITVSRIGYNGKKITTVRRIFG